MTAVAETEGAPTGLVASPYRGLMPYTEADAELFFGREADIALIANNARASRFAVLYGPSGVGKSSVLRAGVVRQIRDENRMRFERFGERFGERLGAVEVVVAYLKEWRDDPYAALAAAVRDAFTTMPGASGEVPEVGADVVEWILDLRRAHGVDLLLILDQFEEFFLYHREASDEFAAVLDRLSERGNRVNVLVSIREDALALLDEFEAEIPDVFDNTLRLEHLDQVGAEAAIRRPLDHVNAGAPEDQRVGIEDELVAALLNQVRTGRVQVDASPEASVVTGSAATSTRDGAVRIEAPFLQLVLTRLWDEEKRRGSRVLRLATLDELGGAQEIVRQHLDRVMRGFTPPEMAVLADAFGHLVTPSGSKIAHRPSDLAEFSGHDPEVMASLLRRLAEGDQRILRDVPPPLDEPHAEPRYEIFHDVLALAVLGWRRRFLAEAASKRAQADLLAEKERAEQESRDTRRRLRRARLVVAAMALLVVACLVLTFIAVESVRLAQDEADRADENAVLADVHRLLDIDPSAALALVAEGWEPGRSEGHEDAFRQALDVADTDVQLELGSPATGAFLLESGDLASVTEDGMVRRWARSGEAPYRVGERPVLEVDAVPDPEDGVSATWLAGDGEVVATVSALGVVSAVDLESGELRQLDTTGWDHVVLMRAPFDGRGRFVAAWDYYGHAAVWDVTTGEVTDAPGLGRPVYDVSVDPSGRYLAVTSRSRLRVWDLGSHRMVASTRVRSHEAQQAVRYARSYFTDDDPLTLQVVVAGSYAEVTPWEVLSEARPRPPVGYARSVFDFDTVSADLLAVALDKEVRLYQDDIYIGQTEQKDDWVTSLAVNPADPGSFALGSNEGEVDLYQDGIKPLHPQWQFLGHRSSVTSVDFSDDGRLLATASRDGTVRVWRVPDRQIEWHDADDWMLYAHVTDDGSYLLGTTSFGTVVRVDRAGTGEETFAPITGAAIDMGAAPDGSAAVVLDEYGDLPGLAVFGETTQPALAAPDTAEVSGVYSAVAWSPDPERSLIVAGTTDNKLVAWDATTREVEYVRGLPGDGYVPSRIAFSGDGSRMVVVSHHGRGSRIQVIEPDGELLEEWTSDDAQFVAVSADGRYVAASGSDHRTIRVWDIRDPHGEVLELEKSRGTLSQVTFSPDADAARVAVGTSEGSIYVWSRETGRLLAVMHRHAAAVNDVAFHPEDVDVILSAGDDGDLVTSRCSVCSMATEDLADAAADRMTQVVTLQD